MGFSAAPYTLKIVRAYHDSDATDGGHEITPDMPSFWYFVFASIALILFAGLMSGLTLGLLSIEKLDLRVICKSGDEKERAQAAKVQALLKHEHLLLVTLLLFNAAAMEALPITLGSIVPQAVAIVISVTAVLFFSEIIPQAVCKTFGLAIGAAAAPLVKVLILVALPVAWPIAKLLDCILGHESGRSYKRKQMAAVLQIHCEDGYITRDEETVMHGAMEMVHKTCTVCMTPMHRVKCLPDNAGLDEATLDWMMETGHSRIPVHDASDRSRLRGVLLTKKLLRHKADDATAISKLELTPIMPVCENTELYELLDMFQTGRSHMAAVYKEGTELGDAAEVSEAQALGIVTLEDVIEELLNEEIVDETDQFVHAEDPRSTSAEEWRSCYRKVPMRALRILNSSRPLGKPGRLTGTEVRLSEQCLV